MFSEVGWIPHSFIRFTCMEVTVFSQAHSPATHDYSVYCSAGEGRKCKISQLNAELVALVKDTEHIKLTRKLSYMLTNFYCNASWKYKSRKETLYNINRGWHYWLRTKWLIVSHVYPPPVRCFDRLISALVTIFIPKSGSRKTVRIYQSLWINPFVHQKKQLGHH